MAELVKLRRPATRDHLRAKPRSQRIVQVYLDADARQAYLDAEDALGKAKLRATEKPKPAGADRAIRQAEADRDAAKAALEESAVEILLQSAGRKVYERLRLKHPPTAEQIAEWEEAVEKADEKVRYLMQLNRPAHDPDGFSVALIAASAVEPSLSEEEWRDILDEWNAAEGMTLRTAAFEVNGQGELVELGKGSNGTHG